MKLEKILEKDEDVILDYRNQYYPAPDSLVYEANRGFGFYGVEKTGKIGLKENAGINNYMHEKTHRDTDPMKKARGFAKLYNKIKNSKGKEKEKLELILKELGENLPYKMEGGSKVDYEIYALGEGIAHTIEKQYGKMTEKPHPAGLRRMKPCEEMIDLIGEKGAINYVKNILAEMYKKQEVISIEDSVNEYKSNVKGFFENYLN